MMHYCKYCGMPMEEDDVFCTRCGKRGIDHGSGQDEGSDPGRSAAGTASPSGRGAAKPPSRDGRSASASRPASAGGPEPAGRRAGAGIYGSGRRDDRTESPYTRYIVIASVVIILAVFAVLFTMLRNPSGTGTGERAGHGDGQASASYDSGDRTGANTQSAGQSRPTAGLTDGQGQDAAGDSGEDPAHTAAAGDQKDTQTAQNAGADRAQNAEADAGQAAQAHADQESTPQIQAEEVSTAAAGDPAGEEDGDGGWEIDEDGNEVYYAPDDAEDQDDDQTQGNAEGSDSSYILPDAGSRYLTRQEAERLDSAQLQMAINEIYARHGRIFDTESIRNYFESKSWYQGTVAPADFDANEAAYFNEYEIANRELLAQIRAEREQAAAAQAAP